MNQDLTDSPIARQNILNNPYAIAEIERAAGIRGISFEDKTVVLKEQVACFFDVTIRTVENYLEQHSDELARNGYEVLKGNRLKSLKLAIRAMDVPERFREHKQGSAVGDSGFPGISESCHADEGI